MIKNFPIRVVLIIAVCCFAGFRSPAANPEVASDQTTIDLQGKSRKTEAKAEAVSSSAAQGNGESSAEAAVSAVEAHAQNVETDVGLIEKTQGRSNAELQTANQESQDNNLDKLRVEAYKSQRVQRHLRATQNAFEKIAEEINKLVEKDEQYLNAIKVVDAPVTEQQRNQARREAVERAMQTAQVKKLKSEAQKHFEEFRRAYNAALEAKKATK
jgi:hypothetical protein